MHLLIRFSFQINITLKYPVSIGNRETERAAYKLVKPIFTLVPLGAAE